MFSITVCPLIMSINYVHCVCALFLIHCVFVQLCGHLTQGGSACKHDGTDGRNCPVHHKDGTNRARPGNKKAKVDYVEFGMQNDQRIPSSFFKYLKQDENWETTEDNEMLCVCVMGGRLHLSMKKEMEVVMHSFTDDVKLTSIEEPIVLPVVEEVKAKQKKKSKKKNKPVVEEVNQEVKAKRKKKSKKAKKEKKKAAAADGEAAAAAADED